MTNSGLTANGFVYAGTGGLMSSTAAATNGQLLIGSTGAAPVAAAITGTSNQISVTNGAGSITLGLPSTLAIPGTVTSFNGVTAAGQGQPVIVGVFKATAQQANYSTTYAVPTGQSGQYRVSTTYVLTQAATTSSTLPQAQYSWTDPDSNVSQTVTGGLTSTANSVGTGGQNGSQFFAKAGTNITLATTGYVSTGATPMQYSVRFYLEYLGS
jgi:hypothetical protein